LAHASPRIRQIAAETNAGLFKFVLRIPDAPLAIEEVADEELPASPALTPTTPTPTTIDHSATLSALTNQFSADHEEPRIAAIDWLSMLQSKSPDRVLAGDGASGVALLKLLSDPSEEVVKRDLALLAQIATASDDEYFHRFVVNLLQLFASDQRLLEARGALIIRILCLSLDPERMFVSMASILETDGDTEFAGIMVQNLNIILMTAPELADLRRKLRETRSPEAAQLFGALYGSWCHNAVSTLALCLLAQAYEHAAGLLQIM
jgi:vacuole morphology and inheritance protein 14